MGEENIQQKVGNIDDILKIVSRANESFVYEIPIPSLQKSVMFREINTSQQKRLLKAVIDSPAYNTEFIFALRQIIKENCVDSIDINNLTVFDKMIIALMMRSVSIGNTLDLEFTVPDTNKKITRTIKISDIVSMALKEITIKPCVIKDSTDNKGIFEISCDLPTIDDEFRLEDELRKNVTTIEIKNEAELRTTVGEVFTNEIVKFIKQVSIKDATTGEVFVFDLKEMKFKDRLAILGKIPTRITNQIIKYINSVQKEFEKVILFKEEIDGKIIEQRLKIDASFFTPS